MQKTRRLKTLTPIPQLLYKCTESQVGGQRLFWVSHIYIFGIRSYRWCSYRRSIMGQAYFYGHMPITCLYLIHGQVPYNYRRKLFWPTDSNIQNGEVRLKFWGFYIGRFGKACCPLPWQCCRSGWQGAAGGQWHPLYTCIRATESTILEFFEQAIAAGQNVVDQLFPYWWLTISLFREGNIFYRKNLFIMMNDMIGSTE